MTYKPKNTKERILHRLKITQGHMKKVLEMVESDVYCVDILHQSHAIQKALKEIDAIILENHLKSCVTDSIRDGKSDEAIAEIMNVFKKKQ